MSAPCFDVKKITGIECFLFRARVELTDFNFVFAVSKRTYFSERPDIRARNKATCFRRDHSDSAHRRVQHVVKIGLRISGINLDCRKCFFRIDAYNTPLSEGEFFIIDADVFQRCVISSQ